MNSYVIIDTAAAEYDRIIGTGDTMEQAIARAEAMNHFGPLEVVELSTTWYGSCLDYERGYRTRTRVVAVVLPVRHHYDNTVVERWEEFKARQNRAIQGN